VHCSSEVREFVAYNFEFMIKLYLEKLRIVCLTTMVTIGAAITALWLLYQHYCHYIDILHTYDSNK